ncbi:MAG: TetR family transcriptional regulator, partial [Planctomycetota bacterium]
MRNHPPDRKTALVLAAGQLFAERGFEGTTVRAIARRAGANVAAVHYHFGSKQALYVAAVGHAARAERGSPVRAFLDSTRSVCTPAAVRGVLREAALEALARLWSPGRARWRFRLLMRALV